MIIEEVGLRYSFHQYAPFGKHQWETHEWRRSLSPAAELVEVVGAERILDRSAVNAWDEPKIAAARSPANYSTNIRNGRKPAYGT